MYIYDLIHRKIAHYQKSLINDFSISDNAVYCIAQDKESGIWMGTFFGGICYLPKRFTPFRSFIAGKTHPDLSGNAIREICPDKWGNLWIGTEDNGINCYELKTGKITHFSPSNPSHPLTATNIHGLLAWEDELWIGTFNKGIEVLDIQTGKRIGWHTPQNTKHALSSDFILCFLPLSSEELLIGTANGVILYNRKDKQFSRWKPIQGLIRQLIKDASDNIWVASTSGVFQFNPSTNELRQYITSNYSAL